MEEKAIFFQKLSATTHFLQYLNKNLEENNKTNFQIAQYLEIKDLINISEVNKKFYNFVNSERIWIDQFNINWKSLYIDDKFPRNYKEKSIRAYLTSIDKR